MSTIWRWTITLSFGGLVLMSCVCGVPAEGAGANQTSVVGVPSNWINSDSADDPVEQFVIRKSVASRAQPAEPLAPAAVERNVPTEAESVAAAETTGRTRIRAAVSWSSIIPPGVVWTGVGVSGVCLVGLIGWQWVRSRRRRDVPEVAVLSLAAFQASSNSVPRSAQSAARRRAA